MNKRVLISLYKKEILDILRDKKTILMMIVVPLILYPLLFFGAMYLTSSLLNSDTDRSYIIGYDRDTERDGVIAFFQEKAPGHEYKLAYMRTDISGLEEGLVDVYISRRMSEGKPLYEIAYKASETSSQTASGIADRLLGEYREKLRSEKFKELGLDEGAVMDPIAFEPKDMSSNEENTGYLLGYIVPFLMITSILMGALYPAIDTTAGEKERGTLETLLTLPVRNLELIGAKFAATSTVAVAAAVLNMISMSLMGAYFYSTVSAVSDKETINLLSFLPAVLIMLLCVIVFAMFASAVCLSACIFAKSFKEAQNYTTPVMLVFMICGMAGMIPALELNSTTALIPVVNIALLISSLFKLHFDLSLIALVLLSNVAYSLLSIVLMTRVFSSEQILFGDGAGGMKLLEGRKNMKAGQIPGVGDCVLLLSVLLLVVLFAGSLLISKLGLYGLIGEQLLLFIVTAFYAWYVKADFKKLFSLKAPRLSGAAGAVLAWAGSYLIVQFAGVILQYLFPEALASQQNDLTAIWDGAPMWMLVLSSALMPAICEEWAFRGFLLGSLKHRYKKAVSVVLCGLIFGLFHLNPLQIVFVGFYGIVMAYVAYESGSIFNTMLMHFLNNLAAVLISVYKDELLEKYAWAQDTSAGAVIAMGMLGVFLAAIGLFIVKKGSAGASHGPQEHENVS
ncbi:MAG: ABC transporter permease subunit [Lachnospiraceae bacterium]|nr:ABC transporter permease subunit [Lachnospiraceae bacterium]